MNKWCVYIVRCRDGSLYTGISTDAARRLKIHNAGVGAKYTRSRAPVTLVRLEPMQSESAARKREAQIKKMTRSAKIALIGRRAER